jgi:hypothetical protein
MVINMKNKTLIFGSILTVLIMLTMPAISSTNVSKIASSKEKIIFEQFVEKLEEEIAQKLNFLKPASFIDLIIRIIESIITLIKSILSLILEIIDTIIP